MPNDYKHLLDAPRWALDRMTGRTGPADTWDATRARLVEHAGAPSSAMAGRDANDTVKSLTDADAATNLSGAAQ